MEFRDSNFKSEGGFYRNICRNWMFRRTGSRRSIWCSLCVEKDILHEWQNTHSYSCVFWNMPTGIVN